MNEFNLLQAKALAQSAAEGLVECDKELSVLETRIAEVQDRQARREQDEYETMPSPKRARTESPGEYEREVLIWIYQSIVYLGLYLILYYLMAFMRISEKYRARVTDVNLLRAARGGNSDHHLVVCKMEVKRGWEPARPAGEVREVVKVKRLKDAGCKEEFEDGI